MWGPADAGAQNARPLGPGPSGESTRSRRRRRPGTPAAPRAAGRSPSSSMRVAGLEPLAALRAQARAVGLAQRRDRLVEADRLDDQRPQLQLVVVGERAVSRVLALLERRPRSRCARSIEGSDLLVDPDLDRVDERPQAAARTRRRGRSRAARRRRRPRLVRDSRIVPVTGSVRTRPSPGSTSTPSIAYSRTVPGASAMRPASAKVERVADRVDGVRPAGAGRGHRRPTAEASSSSSTSAGSSSGMSAS